VGENQDSRGLAARVGRAMWHALVWVARRLRGQVVEFVGGPARARVVGLFGAVLALSSADTATVGVVAPQLEHALHIGNAKVGLLSSVALLIGAVFVVPVGLLVDRIKRIPLLSISIILWSIASLASALAGSYSSLLLSRLALGAVTATAGPAIASLTGDYFPARERGRIWSYILAGEAIGTPASSSAARSQASSLGGRHSYCSRSPGSSSRARSGAPCRNLNEADRAGLSPGRPISSRRPPPSDRRTICNRSLTSRSDVRLTSPEPRRSATGSSPIPGSY
jgi:hypothetical protein